MISPFAPSKKNLDLYAAMSMGLEAVGFNVQRQQERYYAFEKAITASKLGMSETQTMTGNSFVTLDKYGDDIIKTAYPVVLEKLRAFIINNSCEHSLPGAPPCLACIEEERPKIIESSLRYAIASRPKAFGRLA